MLGVTSDEIDGTVMGTPAVVQHWCGALVLQGVQNPVGTEPVAIGNKADGAPAVGVIGKFGQAIAGSTIMSRHPIFVFVTQLINLDPI